MLRVKNLVSTETSRLNAPMRWRVALLASSLVIAVTPGTVGAYNVASDPDHPATHEIMTEQGLDLYLAGITNPVIAQEIQDNWFVPDQQIIIDGIPVFIPQPCIRNGVGIPDQYDPVYGNEGGVTTIAHLWSPEGNGIVDPADPSGPYLSYQSDSFGQPMTLNVPLAFLYDDYPNALQAAKTLWSRALGEYADGNKALAYQYLGTVAHFLGDQSVPTHAHTDSHGPDDIAGLPLDWDAFEEWMSLPAQGGGDSPNAILNGWREPPGNGEENEWAMLQEMGILPVPKEAYNADEQLFWLFLNVNQVADYFASDGGSDLSTTFAFGTLVSNGNLDRPSDFRYPWTEDWADGALLRTTYADIALREQDPPESFPRFTSRLVNDDVLHNNHGESATTVSDADGDLTLIRNHSFFNGIRGIGTLFKMWERAISRPIAVLTVHRIAEPSESAFDVGNNPDFYVGVVMGNNQRKTAGYPANGIDPIGAYLMNRYGTVRENEEGRKFPAMMTRVDAAVENGPNVGLEVIEPGYHFGKSFSYGDGNSQYEAGVDIVKFTLSVWDEDPLVTEFQNPYYTDDAADINRLAGETNLNIVVDLAKSLNPGVNDDVKIEGQAGTYKAAPSTDPLPPPLSDYWISNTGDGADLDAAQVSFSVTVFQSGFTPLDETPPVITILGDNPVTLEQRAPYCDEKGATAFDSVDGDLTPEIESWDDIDNLTPGTYHQTFSVSDAAGNLVEVKRVVNVVGSSKPGALFLSGFEVGPPFPDLLTNQAAVSDPSLFANQTYSIDATAYNVGGVASSNSTLRFFLSDNQCFTADDTELDSVAITGLAPGAGSPESLQTKAPTESGTYWVGACTDAVVDETNLVNQCSRGIKINVTKPDLVAVNPGVSAGTLLINESFVISATAQNTGDGTSGESTLRYYRSTNSIISNADTPLGADAIPELSPGTESEQSTDATAPSSTGTWWVGACVDSVQYETETGNQCSTGVQIDVVAPDLIVFDPSVSSGVVFIGNSYTFEASARNVGGATSGATTLTYYRSDDVTITTSDVPVLGSDAIPELSAGFKSDQQIQLNATDVGSFFIGACVAAVPNEVDTSNQCTIGVPITFIQL